MTSMNVTIANIASVNPMAMSTVRMVRIRFMPPLVMAERFAVVTALWAVAAVAYSFLRVAKSHRCLHQFLDGRVK